MSWFHLIHTALVESSDGATRGRFGPGAKVTTAKMSDALSGRECTMKAGKDCELDDEFAGCLYEKQSGLNKINLLTIPSATEQLH